MEYGIKIYEMVCRRLSTVIGYTLGLSLFHKIKFE